jgi:hypothetical protein
MSTPDAIVVAQIDELLRRSSVRVDQQRIYRAELSVNQLLRAESVLAEMLASIHQLTKYRAELRNSEHVHLENHHHALLQGNVDHQSRR